MATKAQGSKKKDKAPAIKLTSADYDEIKRKIEYLYDRYNNGEPRGFVTRENLMDELGCDANRAKEWGHEIKAARKVGTSNRVTYDIDVVAKHLVIMRGMC